ncbi:MAG: D-threo-aldose 1-dehydrogenase [Pseudonocardiales bacterium]|nr:D-threo-aldose 1-dehydrogenase [Pseudonocardiales bacterium]
MLTRHLGSTDTDVTVLGFGSASIGNLYAALDDESAFAAVDAAWSCGVRYFDTAPHYGLGLSEQRLGKALADRPREQYRISTKVGRLLVPNEAPTGSDLETAGFDVPDSLTRVRDYSRDGTLRSLESSLRRLDTDHVDIVYVHDPDDYLPEALAGAIPALIELRDQGVVGAIGAGMNFWRPLARIVEQADIDAVMLASRWTLIERSAQPLLDACVDRGVSVVVAAPFNSGLLAAPWPADGAYFDYAPAPAAVLAQARRLAEICLAHGTTLPHAALQFPLRHPAVASVVAGMRTADQVEADVRWVTHALPEELWDALG